MIELLKVIGLQVVNVRVKITDVMIELLQLLTGPNLIPLIPMCKAVYPETLVWT